MPGLVLISPCQRMGEAKGAQSLGKGESVVSALHSSLKVCRLGAYAWNYFQRNPVELLTKTSNTR